MIQRSEPTAKDLRKFGLVTGLLVSGLFGVVPYFRHHAVPFWPWIVGALLAAAALARPEALRKVHACWIEIGDVLGWINTRIVMGVVFILIITPIAIVLRIMKYDPLNLSFDHTVTTYRKASKQKSPKSIEVPY